MSPDSTLLTWPVPSTESERIEDVRSFQIMDTPREEPFDGIVEVAAALFETPVALITMMDTDVQWFKASVGTSLLSNAREDSFCNVAIQGRTTLVVPDATRDPRFAGLPFVVGGPQVRFYAGTPLVSDREQAIGTLCVLDVRPRDFGPERLRLLERLARQAVEALESKRLIEYLLDQCIEVKRRSVANLTGPFAPSA